MRVNQPFILFIHHIWGEPVLWQQLHSFNIQDHRRTCGLLVKPFKKFPKSPNIRPAGSHWLTSTKFAVNNEELRRYGQVILVSGYLVLTAVNWSRAYGSLLEHNIDVQSVFSWAHKVARKCESKHWCACGTDGRAVGRSGGRTVTWLPKVLGGIGYQILLPMVLRCACELHYNTDTMMCFFCERSRFLSRKITLFKEGVHLIEITVFSTQKLMTK